MKNRIGDIFQNNFVLSLKSFCIKGEREISFVEIIKE